MFILKILKLLFGFFTKYDYRKANYKNNGYVSRIITVLLYIAMAVGVVAFEYFVVPAGMDKNFVVGIIVTIIAVYFLYFSVTETGMMAFIALMLFIKGCVKVGKEKRKQKQLAEGSATIISENGSTEEVTTTIEEPQSENVPKVETKDELMEKQNKTYRVFDFIAMLIFAGLVAGIIIFTINLL